MHLELSVANDDSYMCKLFSMNLHAHMYINTKFDFLF